MGGGESKAEKQNNKTKQQIQQEEAEAKQLELQKKQQEELQKQEEEKKQQEEQRKIEEQIKIKQEDRKKNNMNILNHALLLQVKEQKKQNKEEKKKEEIKNDEKVVEKKLNEIKQDFNWGQSGQIEVKTIQFQIKYNQKKQGFDVLIPYHLIVNSQLEWKQDQGKKYIFKFFDKSVQDLENGDNKTCINKNAMDFEVSAGGELIGDQQQVKRFWQSVVQNWTSKDLKQEKFDYKGIECSLVAQANISQFDEILSKLIEKLRNQNSFDLMMKSPFLIRNQNDLWQESHIQVDKKFDQKSLRVSCLENSQLNTARININVIKPLIVCSNQIKKTIFQYQQETYADIEMFSQMHIFCWPELQYQEKQIHEEIYKFQEYCDDNFQNMIRSLKEIVSIPLIYKK